MADQSTITKASTGTRTGLFTWNLEQRNNQYVTPRDFGATGAGTADDGDRIRDAIDVANDLGINLVMVDGKFRSFDPIVLEKPVSFFGRSHSDRLRIDTDNTKPGLHIAKTSNVFLRNFDLQVHTTSGIINGSGHNGTCVTTCDWFVPPTEPEPVPVTNIVIDSMRLSRTTGSKSGHAIACMSRTRGVRIVNCDFRGTDDGYHGDAVLCHWGAWSNGVSTYAVNFDNLTGAFTEGRVVVGLISGATGFLVKVLGTGTTGTLYINALVGTFQDNETIVDGVGGSAVANGVAYEDQMQSRFEPGRYSYHPNDIKILNCRATKTGRILAASSSYNIQVDGFTITDPVQLIDLPVGDEADTFASVEDAGQTYSLYSFTNIHVRESLGSGANGITVLDLSGYSTSKQTAADLAGYAGSGYAGMPFNAVQPRNRQVNFRDVHYGKITWKAGPKNPAGSPAYERQIWVRNVIGNVTFEDIDADGLDGVLSLTLANSRGQFKFDRCDLYGGVVLTEADGVYFTNCKTVQPNQDKQNVFVRSKMTTATTDATGFVANATSITLSSPSALGYPIGTPVKYVGGVVYTTKWVEDGDTVVHVSTISGGAAGATTVIFDQSARNIELNNHKLINGLNGIYATGPGVVRFSGGTITQVQEYGVVAENEATIQLDGTDMRDNGHARVPGGPAITTANLLAKADGAVFARRMRFGDSNLISHNFQAQTGWRGGSVVDSVFEDTPIGSHVNVAANTLNGMEWRNNRLQQGNMLPQLAWTPQLRINGAAITAQSSTGTYEVNGNEVTLWFEITATTLGSGVGNVAIYGNPLPVAGQAGNGEIYISGGASLNTAPFCRINPGSAIITLSRHGSTSYVQLTEANLANSAVIKGHLTYRLA